MKGSFGRYLGITVGGALVVVVVAYVFNLVLFSYIPHLRSLISPNEALSLEGLLILILGALILLGLPHARVVGGGRRQLLLGSCGLTTEIESHKNRTKNIRLLGFALISASIMLFLLYFWGIY